MNFIESKDTKEAKKKIRGKPFQKGQSGNPGGKRKGTRNAATLAAEALLDGESAALTRKLVALALKDNMAAMRLVIERILPPRRERPLHFELPPLKTAEDALAALAMITAGVGQGELSDSEAREKELTRLFDDLPHPVYRAMTYEELTRYRDLLYEQINQGNSAGSQDMPETLALWRTASARIEKRFEGKQTWPHWRALWSGGAEGTQLTSASGRSRGGKPAH